MKPGNAKEDKHLVLLPPAPLLHSCVTEERGKERLFVVSSAGVPTLLLTSLLFGHHSWPVVVGCPRRAGRSFARGCAAGLWELHPAAGC